MSSDIAFLRELAREASALVMRVYATEFTVDHKGEDDPVTRADREANTLICERLAKRFPRAAICAEESPPTTEQDRKRLRKAELSFFVDPVDGTREFVSKNGEFCVMIGACRGGVPTLGVIAVPVENKLFWAEVGGGAHLEPLDGTGTPSPLRLLAPARGTLRAVVSRSHPSPRTRGILDELGVTHEVPCGSVGVKAARLLEGAADVYVHPSYGAKLWDACAPEAIVLAAGGVMTTIEGKDIDYRGELELEGGLIATSRELFDAVLSAARGI